MIERPEFLNKLSNRTTYPQDKEIEEENIEEQASSTELSEFDEGTIDRGVGISPPSQLGYDNEWVRFLNTLTQDELTRDIAMYLHTANLTDRAKARLMIYVRTLMDKEFAISRISQTDPGDMQKIMADKALIDADLPLGLTIFDMTPDFHHIVNLLRIKFGIKVRRSIGGFERRIIPTQRMETISEERTALAQSRERNRGIRNKIGDMFRI
jgi:hypothetical protein